MKHVITNLELRYRDHRHIEVIRGWRFLGSVRLQADGWFAYDCRACVIRKVSGRDQGIAVVTQYDN